MTVLTPTKKQLAQIKTLQKQRSERYATRLFVLEGEKVLLELLQQGMPVQEIYITAEMEAVFSQSPLFAPREVFLVKDSVMEQLSDVKTPQGVLFTCEMPDTSLSRLAGSFFLVLDSLQDAGNLGTIIRTAEAFSLDGLILTSGSVDPFHPKVVRASMGSVCRLPLYQGGGEEIISRLAEAAVPIYPAVLSEDAYLPEDVQGGKAAFVIGNEANGVSDLFLAAGTRGVCIPISGAESLNAAMAAGILLYVFHKKK